MVLLTKLIGNEVINLLWGEDVESNEDTAEENEPRFLNSDYYSYAYLNLLI